jgi:hypothetical protein
MQPVQTQHAVSTWKNMCACEAQVLERMHLVNTRQAPVHALLRSLPAL